MNWKCRLAVLFIALIPAFTGYPVNVWSGDIIPGISWAWTGYCLLANLLIFRLVGSRRYAGILAVASLITVPVVFAGGTLSYFLWLTGWGADPAGWSAHYVLLCLTMLTVIPLALAVVTLVPFQAIEQRLLSGEAGVSRQEKNLLMFLRVFNHIVYFVIPSILEIMREEGAFRRRPAGSKTIRERVRQLIRDMTLIGVEGICASIQYIPLWAVEISRLPEKRPPQ